MNNNKILKNASWIIFSRIIQSILSFAISTISIRYLGPSNFGLINYAMAIVAFVMPIMNLGLPNIMVQEIIDNPEEEGKILGSTIVASLVSGIFCFIGILSFVYFIDSGDTETIIVCALYGTIIFVNAFDIIKYWYQAKLLSKYTSIISVIAYIIISSYRVFLLISEKSVRWFAVSYSLDVFIICFVLVFLYYKLGGIKLSFSFKIFKRMIHRSKYYILSGLMITVFAQTDKIMLKILIDESATGLYSAAVICASLSSFVFAAIIDSFRPSAFENLKNSMESFSKTIIKLYSVIIYLALLQCIFIFIFADYIINILYGAEFIDAANTLRIIVWYTTFSYLGSIRNIWLLAMNKQYLIWKIDLSGAVANVFLNILMIPQWGIDGAALASLLTQIFTNVIMGYIITEVRPNNNLMVRSLNPIYLKEMYKKIRKKD